MKFVSRALRVLLLLATLSLAQPEPASAQAVDSLQINVPSLNMPADQQLELGKAIYLQLVSQGVSPATLVLMDDSGVQVSFDSATLAAP